MAGHSKWAKVKHFKGAIDAQRAKIFAKLSREITIAAKLGGGDPDMNARLRMVILKCRGSNMPMDNIQRAIKKGSGGDEGTEYFELTYEAIGPNGVGIIAEVSTDNKNRTAADIRHILSKNGGNLATSGSVSKFFNRKGQIFIARENGDEDELMELALEAGAEDFNADEQGYEIITDPSEFEAVHKKLEEKKIKCEVAEVTALPSMTIPVDAAAAVTVNKLIEALEDCDDVTNVYCNADFPE